MPFAEVDGLRLHYTTAGAGDPPLVLLHAFPLHSGMWAPQVGALSSQTRVVAPDLPGFGRSDAPESLSRYTMPAFADLVAGLLDRLGLDRVVLGGLSMGGYVAFAFLRAHADRLAGLVLADTRAAADTTEVYERRSDQQDQVARIGTAALVETLLDGLLTEGTRAENAELVARVRDLMANSPAGYIGALEAMKHRPDAVAELASITVPTLIVVGDQDGPAPPDVALDMHGRITGSQLVVLPGAGHLSNLEATEVFNAAVSEFLARL